MSPNGRETVVNIFLQRGRYHVSGEYDERRGWCRISVMTPTATPLCSVFPGRGKDRSGAEAAIIVRYLKRGGRFDKTGYLAGIPFPVAVNYKGERLTKSDEDIFRGKKAG